MTDSWKAFWLGLFIILALVIFIWLILFLKPISGDGEVKLTVRFSNIDKISLGTRVTFAGKPVGEVTAIREVSDSREAPSDSFGNLYIYELILKVDSSVQVYTYDEIVFATSGLLGEKSIAIIPKSAPFGAPPSKNMTGDILYAQSTDKLEQTLNKLVNVSETFQDTLQEVNVFVQNNNRDFNNTLCAFTQAANELHRFMSYANETDVAGKIAKASTSLLSASTRVEAFFNAAESHELIERMSLSFDNLNMISGGLAQGEGTLGRLLQSDCFYVQFTTLLCQLQAIMDDIRHYGLLYQFDRKWKKVHDMQRACTEMTGGGYCQK